MIVRADVLDRDEYDELLTDVRDEASKLGDVMHVVIPRPGVIDAMSTQEQQLRVRHVTWDAMTEEERDRARGVGRIFVAYTCVADAVTGLGSMRAHNTFHGRMFNQRRVICTYYDPMLWEQHIYA